MPNSIISMEGTPVNTPGNEFYSFAHHEDVKESMMSMGAPYVYSTPIKKTYKKWPFMVVGMCASVVFAAYIFYQLPEYRLNVRYQLYQLFGSRVENAEWVDGHREVVPFVFLFFTVGIPTLIGGVTLAVGNALPPVPMGMHRTIFRFLKRKVLVGRVNASYAEGVLALLFLGMNAIWFAAIFGRKTNELAAQGALDGASRLQTMGYAFGFNAVLCFSLLVLPATRNCFWMISMGIDYSHAIKYHRWIGFFTVFSVLAHAVPYYKKWISEGTYIKNAMPCLKCDNRDPENRQRLQNFMGQVAFLACLIMGLTSLPVVRRRYYEVFYYSHHLFIVVLCAAVMHFSSFIIWMYPSICLYMMHRILSRSQSAVPCEVVDMEAIPGEITRLVFRRSPGKPGHYHAGQFVYLRVPLLSHTQWHPFSISSSPIEYEDTFTVHVKAIGNWTKELFAVAIQAHEERNVPLIYVDGYYGKMSDDFQHYPVLVMVAGGIGATPIISMIGKILDCMRNNDPVMLNTIVYWHWTSREIGIFHEFEPLLDAIQEYDPDQVRFRVRLCFTGDQHLGGVDIPNGITLKPMDDTSMVPTRPFYQSARSAPYQMLLFFVTFTASFAALLVMRMNYPMLGPDRTRQNMWPLQRFLELVVLLVGATLGWLVATAEPKPRASSRQDQAGGAGETNPFLLDERDSERSSTYSHTLSFDGQEVQFKHPVSRTRLNVKELMGDVVKEQSHNFAINVTGIGTWVSGPISLIHAVETEAAAFAGIFDVHYEEFEM